MFFFLFCLGFYLFIYLLLAALPLTYGFANLSESPDTSGFREGKGQWFSSLFLLGRSLSGVSLQPSQGSISLVLQDPDKTQSL